jgi:lysophospholipase L1-like esterase
MPRPWCRLLALGLSLLVPPLQATPPTASLPSGVRRVVFLGDSITYGGHYTVCVEAYFAIRSPLRPVEFLNAGLPSETVSGLSEDGHAGGAFPRPDAHERLGRVLARLKPDLVFACYGMNDGIFQPFDERRFSAYQAGIRKLRAAVLASGAQLVHATPPPYVDVRGTSPRYPEVLERYAVWLVARRAEGWAVADVHGAMRQELARRRQAEPGFSFAKDGVHPDDAGHWVMARELLIHLGAQDLPAGGNLADVLASHPNGRAMLPVLRTRSELLRDAWLTALGHQRPKMRPGLPLEDVRARAAVMEQELAALRASTANP